MKNPNKIKQDNKEAEELVLKVIKSNEGEDGVSWDVITKTCEKEGLDEARVDETLNSLMDKGLIYEPVLGMIKTT
jgi:DNA replicative helicase MCM subunit Mcm2 (Cdc46/Mcm family)